MTEEDEIAFKMLCGTHVQRLLREMRDLEKKIRNQAFEDAAKIAATFGHVSGDIIAQSIRALKEKV